jgi:hypothetical protein
MRCKCVRTSVVVALVCAALPFAALAAQQLKLGKSDFDWKDSETEVAEFSWAAEVINESSTDVEVEVSLDLLDDDDRVIHTDSTRTTAVAGATTQVERDSSMPFDKAVDVVSSRFRIDPLDPR